MSESLRSPPVWFISCFGLQPETLQRKKKLDYQEGLGSVIECNAGLSEKYFCCCRQDNSNYVS